MNIDKFMTFNLELDEAVKKIKKEKAKLVCIQLPDGLKPQAKEIKDFLEKKTSADIIIWFGSCYGACDIPHIPEADLLIQWGHSEWQY